jgi:PAT family beta-lactamase induction signal transducer AmpG
VALNKLERISSMPRRDTIRPVVFFFLVLPYGISSGFVSITLPFVLTRAGFWVATAVSIVAIGVSANLWRFLWRPVADLTLTARRWCLLGLSAAALTLFLLGLFPLNTNTTAMFMPIVFVSQVAFRPLCPAQDQCRAAQGLAEDNSRVAWNCANARQLVLAVV